MQLCLPGRSAERYFTFDLSAWMMFYSIQEPMIPTSVKVTQLKLTSAIALENALIANHFMSPSECFEINKLQER